MTQKAGKIMNILPEGSLLILTPMCCSIKRLLLRLFVASLCVLPAASLRAQQTQTPTQQNEQQTPTVPTPVQPNPTVQGATPMNPAPQNPTPQNPEPMAPKAATGAIPTSGGAPVDGKSYKVGPADVLLVRTWGHPEFTTTVPVQQNGDITMQLLGDLPVEGKTPVQIQDDLTKAMTNFIKKPLVTVTVAEVGSKRYYMDGYIAHPGEYALVVPTTIFEAISRAGGVQEFANEKKIYVLRGDKRIYFNLKDVRRGRHMEQNIKLEPGDHVWVP
jgi:polysaccharide export outer membrane protein